MKACVSHKDLIWRQVPEPIRESRGVNPLKGVLMEQHRRGKLAGCMLRRWMVERCWRLLP